MASKSGILGESQHQPNLTGAEECELHLRVCTWRHGSWAFTLPPAPISQPSTNDHPVSMGSCMKFSKVRGAH